MRLTTVLFDSWPVTLAHPHEHDATKHHDFYTDIIYVSDTDPNRSLRDVFSDGLLFEIAQKHKVVVEVIVVGTANSSSSVLARAATRSYDCKDVSALTDLLNSREEDEAADLFRVIIFCSSPIASSTPARKASDEKMAAASGSIAQSLAIRSKFDVSSKIIAADPSCVLCSYGSVAHRGGDWIPGTTGVVLWPRGRGTEFSIPVTLPAFMTRLFCETFSRIDVTDESDLMRDHGVAISLEEREQEWICTCRLIHNGKRYQISRMLPPDGLSHLSKAFLGIDNPSEWIINDGHSDNLASDDTWLHTSEPTSLLALCIPGLRDVSRRRAIVPPPPVVPSAATKLASAGVAAASGPEASPSAFVEAPPSSAVSSGPEVLSPASVPLPAVQDNTEAEEKLVSLSSFRRDLLAKVCSTFGESLVPAFDATLKEIELSSPHTLIHSGTDILILDGALPPTLMRTLAGSRASLLFSNGKSVKLTLRARPPTIHLGDVSLDMNVCVESPSLVAYRSRPRTTARQRSRLDLRDPLLSQQQSSITTDSRRGFARSLESKRRSMVR